MESGGASSSTCPRDIAPKKSNKSSSVLVVDNDASSLAIVTAILKEFEHEVVAVRLASDALSVLRMKEGAFDLVITDSDLPDMNGFELVQMIVKEFKNLPVVFISSNPGEGVALKGLESGAAYFIMKPVCADDIKNLWQSAARKNRSHVTIHSEEIVPVSSSLINEDRDPKRKSPMIEGEASEADTPKKKARLDWTPALQKSFLEAIRIIGLNRAAPKKILEVMNIEGLTRDNVASHLQKYRMAQRKLAEASYNVQTSADAHHMRAGGNLSKSLHKLHFQHPVEQYFPGAVERFGKSLLPLSNRGRSSLLGRPSLLGSPSSSLVNLSPSNFSPPLMGPTTINTRAYGNSSIPPYIVPTNTRGYTVYNPFLIGNDINHHAEGQSNIDRDYRVMQPPPNLSPHFANVGNGGGLNYEPSYNPVFDIQHLEARDYQVMQPPPNLSPHFANVGNGGGLNHEPSYNPMFDIQHLEARDYRVMQPHPNVPPHFANVGNGGGLNHEPSYNPTFDIQHLEAFANSPQPLDQGVFHNTSADQASILNQPLRNGGGPFTTSSLYDNAINSNHINFPSFDPLPYNWNLFTRSQELGASPSLNNTITSTTASECEEKEIFNSLLASCNDGDEDITLDGI